MVSKTNAIHVLPLCSVHDVGQELSSLPRPCNTVGGVTSITNRVLVETLIEYFPVEKRSPINLKTYILG